MGLPLVSNKIYAIKLRLRSYSKNFFTNSRFLYVLISSVSVSCLSYQELHQCILRIPVHIADGLECDRKSTVVNLVDNFLVQPIPTNSLHIIVGLTMLSGVTRSKAEATEDIMGNCLSVLTWRIGQQAADLIHIIRGRLVLDQYLVCL